jgi:hypothetical protein
MLITFQDLVDRGNRTPGGVKGNLADHRDEYKKAFDFYIKRSGDYYKNFSKEEQLNRIASLINKNLNTNKGIFAPLTLNYGGANVRFSYSSLVKDNPKFAEYFKDYLDNRAKTDSIKKVAKSNITLAEKYDALTGNEKTTARKSVIQAMSKTGRMTLAEFAPLTNFNKNYLKVQMSRFNKDLPKKITPENIRETQYIVRAKEFKDFFEKNGIEVFQSSSGDPSIKGSAGNIFLTDIRNDPAKLKAIQGFLNERKEDSPIKRNRLLQLSRQHELYEPTTKNLKIFLKQAQSNLNSTIEGYNDKGLKKFLEKNPRLWRNASMKFNPVEAKLDFMPISSIYEKGFDMVKLRKNLKFDLEHNREIQDYWKKYVKDGKVSELNKKLLDADFSHNLSIDTANYNRVAKRSIVRFIENPANKNRVNEIATLEKQLGDLGHRFYADEKFRGRELDIKPSYRDTVLNSWKTALEKSTGLKWKDQIQGINKNSLTKAMQDVSSNPVQLRQLGNLFGCPGTFKSFEKGGRVSLKTGGQGLEACVSSKLKNPENLEKISTIPDEVGGPLSRLKNATNTFLNVAKKGGRFGAFAAAGAATAGLVKEFRNDDPSTYLSNEDQQKNMLIDMLTQPVVGPDINPRTTAFGDAQLPAIGAVTAAGMVPGGAELYRQRTGSGVRKGPLGGPRLDADKLPIPKNRVSPFRAAFGPLSGVLGKGLAATGTPLGMLALEPLYIGQQIADGDSAGEIATNPLNYLGPAFAGSLSKEATRFAGPKISNIMRLGISPTALKTVSRRFGLPGLGISAGISAYEMYQNKKAGRGLFDDG